ncbi:MFS general substrate transporter [Xylaria palmicola]|nr:MFS general substrate transporter [Xylaria palmicola]
MDSNPKITVVEVDAKNPDSASSHHEQSIISATPKRTWRSYFWDTFDKSPEERRFLFKLDAVLLTLGSLGYFIRFLDQVNILSAFVSGMKEDLKLEGNQLNYITTAWTVGYVLGEIPSNIIITKVRPSIWIPFLEVVWSVLTIFLAKCETLTQLIVLRFFIGLAESGFYPGMQYVIGSWYRKDELGKRSCIFQSSASIGAMFSGYLTAAVYTLEGKNGYHGWQWLFIINTVISLPIAITGFFIYPDTPEITRAWWLTKEDVAMANKRMELEGRAKRGKYTKAKFRKIFSSWHIYALTLLYIFFNNGAGYGGQPAFSLWLKSEGYDIRAINLYPTLSGLVTIVATYVYAWGSDGFLKGARWPPIVFAGVVNIFTNISLAVWDIPVGLKWASFFLGTVTGGLSGIIYAWCSEICSDDNEERAFVAAFMNDLSYIVQVWLPLIVWQQVESPKYHKGFVTTVFISAGMIVMAFVIRFLYNREISRKRQPDAV